MIPYFAIVNERPVAPPNVFMGISMTSVSLSLRNFSIVFSIFFADDADKTTLSMLSCSLILQSNNLKNEINYENMIVFAP